MSRVFTATDSRAVSTAITILQLTAASTCAVEIIRAWVTQESSTVSAQTAIMLTRKTATVTGGTSVAPEKVEQGSAAVASTVVRTATGEGTNASLPYVREGFNVLNGWLYLPVPEERIVVAPSGILALTFPIAPASITYDYGIIFREIG